MDPVTELELVKSSDSDCESWPGAGGQGRTGEGGRVPEDPRRAGPKSRRTTRTPGLAQRPRGRGLCLRHVGVGGGVALDRALTWRRREAMGVRWSRKLTPCFQTDHILK